MYQKEGKLNTVCNWKISLLAILNYNSILKNWNQVQVFFPLLFPPLSSGVRLLARQSKSKNYFQFRKSACYLNARLYLPLSHLFLYPSIHPLYFHNFTLLRTPGSLCNKKWNILAQFFQSRSPLEQNGFHGFTNASKVRMLVTWGDKDW